jgi:hypothetical protein
MPNKTYNSVQMKIDFAAQVGDGSGRLQNEVLYSNISRNASDKPSGASSFTDPHNLAVTLAKIYTWANDIFTFNPAGTKKIVIKDGIAKDTTYSFASGTTKGAFSVTPSGGSAQSVYIYHAINSNNTQMIAGSTADSIKLQWKQNGSNTWTDVTSITLGLLQDGKIKKTYLPSYVDDVIEGYYYNGKFYEDAEHTREISAESGKIYVDLVTNDSYRWGGTTYVKISNPTDVFTGATADAAGTAGLVPAPQIADRTKFLKGDGTWASVVTVDEKVKNTYGTDKTYYPAGMTQTSTTTTTQVADTSFKFVGSTGTTSAVGKAELTLGNATASGTAGNKQGSLVIYGSTAYKHTISGAPTADRTLTLPNKTGTIALTSDLPTVNNGKLTIKGGTTSVTEFTANQSGDISFSIVAGTNISVTPDATNHKVTIANTYTYTHPTYTARTGKPTANVSIDFDTTSSFTLSQVKSDGTGHVTDMTDRTVSFALPSDIPRVPTTGTNKYLRDDGTWQDPMSEYTTLILNCTYDTSVT